MDPKAVRVTSRPVVFAARVSGLAFGLAAAPRLLEAPVAWGYGSPLLRGLPASPRQPLLYARGPVPVGA